MPDFLTHMIFGKDVSASNIKEEKMFNLGLMGPDQFFYVTGLLVHAGPPGHESRTGHSPAMFA